MGSGSYSVADSMMRTANFYSADVSRDEIFVQRKITNDMDPANTIRECCDSEEHPNTIPIIVALDVTGSMGSIPDQFIRESMTKMMDILYRSGLRDTQVLFLGIGDHECDISPLQVGQFEADDELLDKWLKDIYLEGGGGGNAGESYLLAWYYAARNTKIDSFDKRSKKGFLFTIGDEPCLKHLPANAQKSIFGDNGIYNDITADKLLEEASEKYNVYHFNVTDTYRGSLVKDTQEGWKQRMGDRCIIGPQIEIAEKIANIVKDNGVGVPAKKVDNPIEDKAEVEMM